MGLGDGRIRSGRTSQLPGLRSRDAIWPAEGNVGAGAGATVGKLLGARRTMKGGMASIQLAGLSVGAFVAINAVGNVIDPDTARPIAGARTEEGRRLLD